MMMVLTMMIFLFPPEFLGKQPGSACFVLARKLQMGGSVSF
jgi:hypothetical protein